MKLRPGMGWVPSGLLAAVLVMTLPGCLPKAPAGPAPETQRGAVVSATVSVGEPTAALRPPDGPPPEAATVSPPAGPTTEVATAPPDPAPAEAPLPRTLVGLSREKVTELLGRPHLRRRDDPAELWHYRTDACVLHLFIYENGGAAAPTVAHVEIVVRDGAPVSRDDCLASVIGESRSGQPG